LAKQRGHVLLFYEQPFFALFAVVFPLNFLLKGNLRIAMLLIASYAFYAWFDWRFLSLLWLSTIVDFFVGLLLANPSIERRRKLILTVSIIANLGMLGFFKYFQFLHRQLRHRIQRARKPSVFR
jgi:alginate O-acetyltransferase complex protein AlgI